VELIFRKKSKLSTKLNLSLSIAYQEDEVPLLQKRFVKAVFRKYMTYKVDI
jgi:hypothetical protein